MSNARLEALRALYKKEKERKADGGNTKRRGNTYPFWQMEINDRAIVRLLPDKNEENPYMFYVDKLEHTLSINGKEERVSCLQNYAEKCPICDLSRAFYKEEGKTSVSGKYYYRKKVSLVRVLVVEDPLPVDEETGENAVGKVLNTQFGYQLMETIKEEISGDDLGEDDPWDMKRGFNFTIKKTPQGQYGTYTVGSGFARKSTPIPASLIDEIELVDLATLLPANPGYEAVKRKLDAHLNGSDDADDADDQEDKEEEAPKPTSAKTTTKVTEDVEETEEEEEEAPKPTAAKKTTTKVVEEVVDEDEEEDAVLREILRKRAAKNK